jgi:3-mercaptopyruvate sulfurtransferase SseA
MTAFPRKILVFVAVSLLLLTQACSPTGTAYPNPYPNPGQVVQPTAAKPQPTIANPTPATVESVVRVSLVDAKSAFDAKVAVFLDVRAVESFDQAHIPGALNIPLDQLEARLSELDPNAWIITYCT